MSLASIDGFPCETVRVSIPQRGAWFADVVMIEEVALSGAVTLDIGSLALSGTITATGTRGAQTFARITAGAGAWATELPAKHYHSDARVRVRTIAEDAARAAGETLETLTTTDDVGTAYTRRAGPAARTLEDVLGPYWYVDTDGVTRAGPRTAATPESDIYTVIDTEPDVPRAVLEMNDLASVTVGMTLEEDLDAPLTVREIEIEIDPETARMIVWGGGDDESGDRLGDAFRALVQRERARDIFGLWRYRVSQMDGERVELQAMAAAAGLPDVLPVHMRPGVAGAHADLAPGSEVLVQFIEGDPRRPIITHYAGKGDAGHVPVRVTMDASTELLLGAGASDFVALAQKVLDELNEIRTAHDTHIHVTTATVGATATVGVLSPTASPLGAAASVAASLTKAE